nr:P-type conjugative transfer protein TrbJ [uncultured Acidocella sp.]
MNVRKMRRGGRAATSILAVAVSLSPLAAAPAAAQWIVFDPTNYVQNVLTAARELQQVDNQIQMLTNQATMLVNQARNLTSLPLSTLNQLESSVQQTESLISQAQNIAFNVQQIEQAFTSTYGSVPSTASTATLIAGAQTRWQNSVGGFEDSLKVQAGVVGNIPSDGSAMTSLVSASQSATGALQAAQAGNQLLALQSRQLSDLIAVMSAKGRADALAQADTATTEAESQALYSQFSTLNAYVPGAVTMFNGQ